MAITLRRNILCLFSALALGVSAAPLSGSVTSAAPVVTDSVCADRLLFNHLDVSASVGSTGVGLTLSAPVTKWARVRAGIDYMPRFNIPMTFDMMTYGEMGPATEDNFDRLSQMMEDFTGFTIDRKADMNAHATMVDFKFMVDVFPLRGNRNFYVTAGFSWGSSRLGHIENTVGEAPSMVVTAMYNRAYDYFHSEQYLYQPIYDGYWIDPDVGDQMRDLFNKYGKVGAMLGHLKDGTPYLMQPGVDGTVMADMYVNHFKPYIGVGYNANLTRDGRWSWGVDAGALFWGRPRIYSHDYYIVSGDDNGPGYGPYDPTADVIYGDPVDLAHDVEHVDGRVGRYANMARVMHVWPSVNIHLTLNIF